MRPTHIREGNLLTPSTSSNVNLIQKHPSRYCRIKFDLMSGCPVAQSHKITITVGFSVIGVSSFLFFNK